MDARRFSFLQAVAGPDGANALAKAVAADAALEWALLPRVVMGWVEVAGETGHDGGLPGAPDVTLTLTKAEAGYDFVIGAYADRGAPLERVSAAVAVALGLDADAPPPLRSAALAKLGKSVDLLVRARSLRKALQRRKGGAQGHALPGTTAKPIAPAAPEPPQAVEDEKPDQPAEGTQARAAAPKATLPGQRPRQLKVTKAEAAARCPTCSDPLFAGGAFVGCACFAGLAKSARSTATAAGYTIEFGRDWDADAIATLAESFGR